MLTRRAVLERAVEECVTEMYAKAQPPCDFADVCRRIKEGDTTVESKEFPLYNRHYLSQEEFTYILDKYIQAYRIAEQWDSDIELLVRDLTEGGLKDVYVKDEDGRGHREAAATPTLSSIVGEEKAKEVFDTINDIKTFYRFDREESSFRCTVCLGSSPTGNKDTVINYWKSQGVDLEIEDRDPDTLWARDYYGENWKQVLEEEELMDKEDE